MLVPSFAKERFKRNVQYFITVLIALIACEPQNRKHLICAGHNSTDVEGDKDGRSRSPLGKNKDRIAPRKIPNTSRSAPATPAKCINSKN